MAQGPVAALQSNTLPSMASKLTITLSEEEEHQLRECERILKFRDEVLSGAHPRITVPAHLVASKKSSESRSPGSLAIVAPSGPAALLNNVPTGPKSSSANVASSVNGSQLANNLRSFNANAHRSVTAGLNITSGHLPGHESSFGSSSNFSGIPTGPRAASPTRFREASGSAQFDPVLLTKSDDLIKAEIQLQRKRLESALSDQVQQHRATKNSHAAEALADFDLADVLMKALKLVQTSAIPQTDANLATNASGTEGDSFDDDTFYSSKHDTPESHQTHRLPDRDESGEAQAREDSHYEPPMVIQASPVPEQQSAVAMPPFVLSSANATQPQQHRAHQALVPESRDRPAATYFGGEYQTGTEVAGTRNMNDVPMEIISSQESGEASSSRDSGQLGGDQQTARHHLESVTQQLIDQGFGRHQSPILRAHNLSPIAPQPAHVSPLATARQPPVPRPDAPPAQATPAQVTALRNDRSNGSSPESSPQGGKPNKKGKKKNKRKADRMATNTVASPYIKPEPRSPSPLTAPQFTRPNKRQRQAQRTTQPGYDQSRIEEPVEIIAPHAYPSRVYREDRVASGYSSPSGPRPRQDSRHMVLTEPPRYERDYHDEIRPAEAVQYVRRSPPGAPAYPYAHGEVQSIRSVSRAAVERPYSYYDVRDAPRAVVRQMADRDRSRSPVMVEDRSPAVMGPPRLPRSRIVHVDEFGREYLEPAPRPEGVVTRRSVVPRPAYDERDEYYEMPRSTTVIRRSVAPVSAYGEPEIIYERPAPPVRAASTMPGPQRYDEEVVYHRPASPSGYATTRRVVTRPAEYAVPEYRYYRERDYQAAPPSQAGGDDYYEVRNVQERRPADEAPREYRIRATTVRPDTSMRPEVVRMSSVRPESYGAPIPLDERQVMAPPRPYSTRPMAPPQQQQYVHPWPEYGTRPYPEQVDEGGDDGAVTYVESAPREMYR
ncbi:hypothetical protein J7T55_014604 [Diaporthe amygdali]|uniref:uncharacterized protein n=1 Tax=Phomopsis amygdali TaxID=1214568 RepID=UPI0022FF3F7F|nr:uncharacterized protein J7T55_014604 [Diaporthe amygdali]KAJ0118151.1 hypothetical protein J7T55_014604 [Diaporthe amygdali]